MVMRLIQVEKCALSDGSGFSKNVIIFSADKSLSVHFDKKKKDTLILG